MSYREKNLTHDLAERVKELECLYAFSRLTENRKQSLQSLFEKAVKLFPPSWQYPEVCCARISVDGKAYLTRNFKESPWSQKAVIKAFGERIGFVEVGYLMKRPASAEGPFLKEERKLINAMADRLGKLYELKTLDQSLARAKVVLKKQNETLIQKNQFLRELLGQVEIEKANIKNNIIGNLNQTVFPLLERLKESREPAKYLQLIIEQLRGVTSSFGIKIGAAHLRLTPREMEICGLIKANLSTKQISSLLNLSVQTVDHHRKSIRKKLGVVNQDVNLTSFLQQAG